MFVTPGSLSPRLAGVKSRIACFGQETSLHTSSDYAAIDRRERDWEMPSCGYLGRRARIERIDAEAEALIRDDLETNPSTVRNLGCLGLTQSARDAAE
jgi:hypothetical protein